MELFVSLGVSLTLTLILEVLLALVWRIGRQDLPVVVLANVLTNPAVVLGHWIALLYWPRWLVPITLALELGAVAAEGEVYRRRSQIRHPWGLSLAANALSFCTGLLL